MNSFIKGILYSISYFSILPVLIHTQETNKSFYKGVLFGLPIVGLLLGIIVSGLYIAFTSFLASWYSAFFISVFYLFLYGFLHLEAVADTIDGYYSALSNKNTYDIMKEPQIGAIGAIGTFCFVLFKVLALSYLLLYEHFLFIILAFMLSRFSVFFSLSLEYHSKSVFILSLKDAYQTHTIIKLLFLPLHLSSKFILTKLKNRIGFLNGDTLGFSIELIEIIILNIGVIIFS